MIRNRGGIHKVAGCAPRPISRPIPRKCHLKFAGCFTMQIRCKTMRPTGYFAIVVIIFGLLSGTRQPGRSFKKIRPEERLHEPTLGIPVALGPTWTARNQPRIHPARPVFTLREAVEK